LYLYVLYFVALQDQAQPAKKKRGFADLPLRKANTDFLEEVQIKTRVGYT
jgi:hypothetical protein